MRFLSISVYLRLLTTTLGVIGLLRTANAHELPNFIEAESSSALGLQTEAITAIAPVQSTFLPEQTAVEEKTQASAAKPEQQQRSSEEDTPSTLNRTLNAEEQTLAEAEAASPESGTMLGELLPQEQAEQTIPEPTKPTPSTSPVPEAIASAVQLEISPAGDFQVSADGRSILKLQGRITDEKGELIRQNAIVTLSASAGNFVGVDQDPDRPGFQAIADQGEFTAQLQSTLVAQKVRVRAAVDLSEVRGVRSEETKTPLTPSSSPLPPHPSPLPKELEAYTQVEFITNLRPSIATGVVSLRIGKPGTDFYSSFREFLNPDTLNEGYGVDLKGAVFATGKVGEWLFTGAYNSDRPLNQTCEGTTRLFKDIQFCEQNYPVYGDSSTVDYLTPSIDSVYLRFERNSPVPGAEPDYGMWGDYNTREFARSSQLYTATNRQLHGFKANYNLGNLQATAFYGNNVDGFQRDTIAPNGTSGYYFLSHRLVVGGSENVFLETEEINRPGTVIERQALSRGSDYEVDYDRGTLLFRRPIRATEFDPFGVTLVRRIVVTYQFESDGNETNIYAGRLQYNFSQAFNQESWAGLSYLREDQGARNFELYGLDVQIPLGENGRLVGEFARSTKDSLFRGNVSGSAYRLELNGAFGKTRGLPTSGFNSAFAGDYAGIPSTAYGATPLPTEPTTLAPLRSSLQPFNYQLYYRSVDENFANDATFSFTPGQTRYGGAIAAAVTSTTQLQLQYDHETNYGIAPLVRIGFDDLFNPTPEAVPGSRVDNSLTTITAGVYQKLGIADLSLAYVNRSREDRIAPGLLEADSSQLVSRFNLPLAEKLTFRAQNELNLGGNSDPLYPDRTTLGLEWAAYPGVSVRLAHQFFSGGQFAHNSITSLDTILEHRLSDDTAITGRYSIIGAANAMTSQGAIGLNHRWAIAPGLRLNLGYEHIFGDVFVLTAAGQQFAQPYAVGQTAAALGLTAGDSYSVGLEYTDNPNFKASARFERRTSASGNNTLISAGALGKISPSLTALVRYQQANYANQLLAGALGDTTNLKVGLAYRDPSSDRFNALLRYEYRQNPFVIPNTLLFGSGTGSKDQVLAVEAIYAPNWQWEFYGKYAIRSSTSYLTNTALNSSTISLAQLRTRYQLGYNTDLVGEVRWINQPSVGYSETGVVVEAGYYLTPNLRLAAGYSFGGVDDRDFNGYRSQGGPYLGLTLKLNELFEGFGLQKPAPPQPQKARDQSITAAPLAPIQTSTIPAVIPALSSGTP